MSQEKLTEHDLRLTFIEKRLDKIDTTIERLNKTLSIHSYLLLIIASASGLDLFKFIGFFA